MHADLGATDVLVPPQPCGTVGPRHPELSEWIAIGHPSFARGLTPLGVLLGRDDDPHLAERWRAVPGLWSVKLVWQKTPLAGAVTRCAGLGNSSSHPLLGSLATLTLPVKLPGVNGLSCLLLALLWDGIRSPVLGAAEGAARRVD
jgi:hypothetical protein